MKVCLTNVLVFILISVNQIFPQISSIPIDSSFNNNFMVTNLYNDINLANLNSVLNYTKRFQKFGVSLRNYYLSNVSKLDQNFFRDYNNFRFILFYNLKENLDIGAGFQNRFLSDEKNVLTNQNNNSYYFANVDYRVNNSVAINTKVGLKTEDQIGEYNTGFSTITTADANNLFFKDYYGNGRIVFFYENLIQKQNHNYEIAGNLYKRFSTEADNTGSIRFYNQRNDFYTPATLSVANQYHVANNIEQRIDNFIQLGDNLNYTINTDLYLSLSGFFFNRIITREFKYRPSSANILFENVYDTKIIENNLEFAGGLNYNWNRLTSLLKMQFTERSENHTLINKEGLSPGQIVELEDAEKNKNNNSRRTSLLLDLTYPLSNTNSFGFTGSTSLLRYDTDFDENFDDRDETETILSAAHRYNNLLNFEIQTRFEVILSKLNYIFAEKSANNYKNRIYKLSTETFFKPIEKLSTKNYVQVLANYTVYDFEDIVSQVQSFSYRQLYIRDSTTYILTRDLDIDFKAELKFYEQGQFNDRNFSVKPIAYFVEQMYNPEVNFFLNYLMRFGIGYQYFSQKRYQYETGGKQLVNTYRTYGPVGKINFYLNNNSIINFTGGIDYIEYDVPHQLSTSLRLQLNVLWNM